MNWKRIWTGAALALLAMTAIDFVSGLSIVGFSSGYARLHFNPPLFLPFTLQNCVQALVLSWLYVLARPRLGPGPRTALLIGSLAWLLSIQGLNGLSTGMRYYLPLSVSQSAAGFLFFGWLKYAAATYVAGWQYLEKAP